MVAWVVCLVPLSIFTLPLSLVKWATAGSFHSNHCILAITERAEPKLGFAKHEAALREP